MANEHRSNVDVSCVEAAFDRIKKDWMDDIFQSLTISEAMVLLMMALIGQQEEVFTTQDLYRNIKSIKIDEDIRKRIDYKPLSERRVLEILRDLETARARARSRAKPHACVHDESSIFGKIWASSSFQKRVKIG